LRNWLPNATSYCNFILRFCFVAVKNFSTSSGNTNGYTKVSSTLSNDKSSPSLSGSSKTDSETSDKSSTAVDTTSSCIKKIVVYSRKTNVKIEDGGTMLPVSDDKWVAYSYSHWDSWSSWVIICVGFDSR